MTPGDEAFEDALRRADVHRLAGLVDPAGCPPDVFERLLRHEDARVRSLGLMSLAERVAVVGGCADACVSLAALLPAALSAAGPAPWSAEDSLVLAELYARLAPHAPKPYALAGRVPSWRTAGLPERVRIAWLSAEIANDPTVVRREPASETLYQAVRETGIATAGRPRQLVAELSDSGDPVLVGESLRLAREGLHAGVLPVAHVRAHLVRLLGLDAEHAVGSATVVAVLAELSEPWATLEPLPPSRLSGLLTTAEATARPAVAEAALTALARHGHSGALRQAVDDPDLPPRLRRRALELLGALATRDDIRELTAMAASDPLLFGEPAVACLRGLHRRGHFVTGPDVPVVVALALADHAIAPCEIATVLFTCRQDMFRLLIDAPADDPSWPRRLALLVALAGQGTVGAGEPGELPVGGVITRMLRATSSPRPFLDALRALRHTAAEEAVLARLATEPATVLRTLEAIGGRRTVSALRDGLGLAAADGESVIAPHVAPGTVAPHLRAERHRALELLWQLTEDPADRRALLVRLDPAELPARIAADLGGPDEGELALLGARANRDVPVAALCGLAAHGGVGTLPVIADLLLRVVAELAYSERALTEPAPFRPQSRQPDGSDTGQWPTGEPAVPGEVLEAVRGLGRRLHARRRIRPVCLLDAADAEAAGNALAATMVLDLLDRPEPTDDERVILLELLTRIPYPHTRPRVHRLLRHRNPHLRKHVIALLAQDSEGADAQALSASLITLTTADDIRTVRQALLALGHARARWAAGAIAACLDHPNMNIKKTAAGVLVHAGTAVAVPRLLNWSGRHDNPGFRTALADALRSVLGDAYEATLRAAVDGADEPRARRLLSGCLAERPPDGTADAAADAQRSDFDALKSGGWRPAIALRIARRGELPARHRPHGLRPTLADWLALADSTRHPERTLPRDPAPGPLSDTQARLVRTALWLCPPPLSDAERRTYARFTPLLLMCLTDAATWDSGGPALVSVLEALAPELPTGEKRAVADAVRALPGTAPAPTLTLLRHCGAVLTRADLDQALRAAATRRPTDARAGRAPRTEVALLREAFGITDAALPADARAWRVQLEAAVRGPSEAEDFRRTEEARPGGTTPNSRSRLAALADAYPAADPATRSVLIDWMTALQPLDVPPWTLGEAVADEAATAPTWNRTVRADDLDQPRSAALRARLLDMLGAPDPDRRGTAAVALLKWPDPDVRSAVLRAYLHGRVDVDLGVDGLADAEPPDLLAALADAGRDGAEIRYERLARLAGLLDPSALQSLVPRLLEWWQQAPQEVRPVLDAVPADTLAVILGDRIEAGAWGYLDLLAGRTLLRTPALTEIRHRLRAEGRDSLADTLRLVDGPLLDPGAELPDAHERARSTQSTEVPDGPSRRELLRLARTGSPDQIRRALTRLAEAPGDPELLALVGELLHHPRPRVRLHAHRTSRALFDRETYLRHTSTLLGDAQPDVVRSAVRTLTHAAWEPAVPPIVGLLDHPHPAVRGAAADGLARMPGRAVPALRHAADHARPDRRSVYTAVLDRIMALRSATDTATREEKTT
ncbi:HEAT repeat domain-containing protein [Streptomyces niveus]|uniref:HEAT repeat domain-containing protein n=1 Tax=Streptomyces niveus TaxID=193462 RepID=UPI0036D1AC16